jgi:hypothetical protein
MDIHDELNEIRRLAGLLEQARPTIPTVNFPEVYHVGDLNPSSKKKGSFEGAGLSFSFHPKEWSKIAKLGGQVWILNKPSGGTFIDFVKMTTEQLNTLMAWGVQNGYIEPMEIFTVTYFDDEQNDDMQMQFSSREEAEYEAEVLNVPIGVNTKGFKATSKMVQRVGWIPDLTSVQDHLATLYAEDNGLDGVWWNETLDVPKLSAPRGVIVPAMVRTWHPSEVNTSDTEGTRI